MTTADYPRRRAVARQRPWQPEVPAAFAVPDVSEVAAPAGPTEVAPKVVPPAGGETTNETVTGRSRDRSVDVELDLRGHLCHLRIDPRTLRGPHPHRVGAAVVEAMAEARGRVLRRIRERRRR